MEPIWQWGIDVIIVVQKIRSPFFDNLFFSISFFGTHIFFLMLLPFLYWCIDKKYASRLFILFLISSWSNTVLKDLIHHPRPYNLDEGVKIGSAGGYGIPSGHAQQSLVMGVSIVLWQKDRFFTYMSCAAVLLIALSRIYLGVHFPTDILGGWIAGAVLLVVLWPLSGRIEKLPDGFSPYIAAAASILIPVLLSLMLPSKWSVMSMGALSGFCTGLILEKKSINFAQAGNFRGGFLRYVSGALILMLIFSLDRLQPEINLSFYMVMVFVHSWIAGIWVSAGAPWMFKKIGI